MNLQVNGGGVNGKGLDEDGNYVFHMKNFTTEGSYHANQSVDARDMMHDGKAKLLLSISKDTQNNVFEFSYDNNGNVVIPKDSEAAKILFSVENGHAVFNGAYAEVAEPMGYTDDGTEKVRVLGTLVGRDNANLKDIIVDEKLIPNLTINMPVASDFDVEPPIPIPMTPRRPLERGAYLEKKEVDSNEKITEKTDSNIVENQIVDLKKSQAEYDAVFKEFEDFTRNHPDEKIPEELEQRYFVAENTLKFDKKIQEAYENERSIFAEFEDYNKNNPDLKIPLEMEERYSNAEAKLAESIKAKETFEKDNESISQFIQEQEADDNLDEDQIEKENVVEVISDSEYNKFIDKGIVLKKTLNNIAGKIKGGKALSQREIAIFTDKTSEINDILRNI